MSRYVFSVKQRRLEDARQWLIEHRLDPGERVFEGARVLNAVVHDNVVVPEELGPEFKLAFAEDIAFHHLQERD